MTTETDRPTVRFGRQSTRGFMLGFSTLRAATIGSAVVVAVVGLAAAGFAGLMFAAVLWVPLMAGAFWRVQGRPLVEWAPTWLHWQARERTGQAAYRARLVAEPRPAGTMALPGEGAALRWWADDRGICFVHDPHRQTLAAVLWVEHSAYALLSPDQQHGRVWGWGRALANLANSVGLTVQILESVVADPGTGIRDWWAEHGQADDDDFARRVYESLLGTASLGSSAHRTTISLGLDMRAAAREIGQSGGGVRGAAAVLATEMAGLEAALRAADLRVGHWLGAGELAAIVRAAYDPWAATVPALGNLAHAGPLAVAERWDRLRTDSGWASVLWIAEWPRIDVAADFLHPLVFAPGVRRSLSVVARPIATTAALRSVQREKTDILADQAQRAKIGQVQALSGAQELRDVEAREAALVAGHADVEFVGLVAVWAPAEAELDAAVAAITRAAGTSGCDVRPIFGAQSQAFLAAALPLARRAW